MKPAFEALKEIEREYNTHPDGWCVYTGIDKTQFPTVYVFHKDYAWTLKFPLFGMNGLADKVKIEEDELISNVAGNPASYGLRQITFHKFSILMNKMRKEELNKKQKEMLRPVSVKEIMENLPRKILCCPYYSTTSPIAPISASQVELEAKLKRELAHLTDGMYL